MRFRLLGPLEVRAGKEWQGIGARKWRSVLAALLIEAGQIVPADVLINEVWGDAPPAKAANLLSIYVLRLRRLLDTADARLLVTRSPGYQLLVTVADTDAMVFETMVSEGRRAFAAGDAPGAVSQLTEALALWHGRPLADVPATPLVEAEAERLTELRLGAIELRITAELATGRSGRSVPEIRRLLADHPLREGLWLLLMRALDGAGRHAEALEVFGQARTAISGQLGVDPGAELRQLHARLLAKDQVLADEASDVRPWLEEPDAEDIISRASSQPATAAPASRSGTTLVSVGAELSRPQSGLSRGDLVSAAVHMKAPDRPSSSPQRIPARAGTAAEPTPDPEKLCPASGTAPRLTVVPEPAAGGGPYRRSEDPPSHGNPHRTAAHQDPDPEFTPEIIPGPAAEEVTAPAADAGDHAPGGSGKSELPGISEARLTAMRNLLSGYGITDRKQAAAWADALIGSWPEPEDRTSAPAGRRRGGNAGETGSSTAAAAIPDAEGHDICPDPLTAKTAAEFIKALAGFRLWAGDPSYREMEELCGRAVVAATMCTALGRDTLPSLRVVLAIITGCQGSEEHKRAFTTAWRKLRMTPGPTSSTAR